MADTVQVNGDATLSKMLESLNNVAKRIDEVDKNGQQRHSQTLRAVASLRSGQMKVRKDLERIEERCLSRPHICATEHALARRKESDDRGRSDWDGVERRHPQDAQAQAEVAVKTGLMWSFGAKLATFIGGVASGIIVGLVVYFATRH